MPLHLTFCIPLTLCRHWTSQNFENAKNSYGGTCRSFKDAEKKADPLKSNSNKTFTEEKFLSGK